MARFFVTFLSLFILVTTSSFSASRVARSLRTFDRACHKPPLRLFPSAVLPMRALSTDGLPTLDERFNAAKSLSVLSEEIPIKIQALTVIQIHASQQLEAYWESHLSWFTHHFPDYKPRESDLKSVAEATFWFYALNLQDSVKRMSTEEIYDIDPLKCMKNFPESEIGVAIASVNVRLLTYVSEELRNAALIEAINIVYANRTSPPPSTELK